MKLFHIDIILEVGLVTDNTRLGHFIKVQIIGRNKDLTKTIQNVL